MRLPLPVSVFFLACLTSIAGCDRSAEKTGEDTNGPAERDYLLTVSRPNTLNLIDLFTNEVVRQCTLPGVPTPGTVVISPDKTVAYVLADRFSDVFGYRLDDCELVFSSRQSSGNQRVKTMASLAVSPDGSEVYTHQNRVTLYSDHYRAEAPRVAVFDTAAGLDAPEIRSFEAPRQVTIMTTGADGQLYLGGPARSREGPAGRRAASPGRRRSRCCLQQPPHDPRPPPSCSRVGWSRAACADSLL